MRNVMDINGYKALIAFDPDTNLFRGEFLDLNGGADFYAADVASLRREGETSLKVFLDMCQEDGVAPVKRYSGKLMVRLAVVRFQTTNPRVFGSVLRGDDADGSDLESALFRRIEMQQ